MTRIHSLALVALVTFAPLTAAAASLNPLDGEGSLDSPLPANTGDAALGTQRETATGEDEFRFVGDDVLTNDPLRGALPENQWATPRPSGAGIADTLRRQ